MTKSDHTYDGCYYPNYYLDFVMAVHVIAFLQFVVMQICAKPPFNCTDNVLVYMRK
jgi:hypothetical protein